MSAQEEGNSLTLEVVARRLEALERDNERMRSENEELRGKVASLEGARRPPEEGETPFELDSRVSRRQLLGKVGAAAAGLVVAGALTQRDIREAKAAGQYVGEVNLRDDGAVDGINSNGLGYGVFGKNTNTGNGTGVYGKGVTGVKGEGYVGVHGDTFNASGFGVYGYNGGGGNAIVGDTGSDTAYGVKGRNFGTAAGVLGESVHNNGPGVVGKGINGVYGESSTPDGWGGVVGRNNESGGIGTYGEGLDGVGVQGFGKTGVHGKATGGYGGLFEGSKAQLMLKPGDSAGKPTSGTHTKGEIYMDSNGALFVCTAGDDTTVGTWKKVRMVAV